MAPPEAKRDADITYMYYITYLFGMAGLKGNNNLVASSIQYVINVFMTIFALIFIDRWGRRLPLLVGSFFMALWLFINAGLMASYGHPAPPGGVNHVPEESWQISGPASKAVIACTYLFVASFAPTWGPVSWIYPPELFPLRVRGKAVALCTAANWIMNFALSKLDCSTKCAFLGADVLHPRLLRPTRLRQHPVESLCGIWRVLCHNVHPCLPLLPRNLGEEPRRSGSAILAKGTSLED